MLSRNVQSVTHYIVIKDICVIVQQYLNSELTQNDYRYIFDHVLCRLHVKYCIGCANPWHRCRDRAALILRIHITDSSRTLCHETLHLIKLFFDDDQDEPKRDRRKQNFKRA